MPPYTTRRPSNVTCGWSSHIFWLKWSWAVLSTKFVHIMCSSEIVRPLVADDLELADRLSELRPLLRVAQRCFQRRLRDAHRARRRLDASDLVGAHQLPEALPFDAAEEVLRRHLVPVELQRVGVHPLVADGRDRAAGELRWMELVTGGLGDEEDGEPVVLAGGLRIGDHRRAEQMRLVRPGAPGLLAGDEVLVALLHGPALDSGRVAARVGLG